MSNKFNISGKLIINSQQAMTLPKISTAPASPVSGDMYFNTTTNEVQIYKSGSWQDVSVGSVALTGQSLAQYSILVGNAAGSSVEKSTSASDILADETDGLTIQAGVITNAKISASAAIAYSKLALSSSIVNADIASGAAIALSKLAALTIDRALVSDGSGAVSVSSATSTELGYLVGVTSLVQSQLTSAQGDATQALSDASSAQADITNHIADAVDAHDASAISNIASGNLAATDQQTANNELQSDIDTRALDSAVIKKDGSVNFTANQSMGNNKLVGLSDPTSAQDAATKAYVDAVAQGLNIKSSTKAATTAALPAVTAAGSGVGKTLTADASGLLSIDGVSTWIDVVADSGSTNPTDTIGSRASRVLIKDQANQVNNGVYVVQDKGSAGTPFILIRSIDTDGTPSSEVESIFCFVREGTVNANAGFVQTVASPTVDTSNLSFTQFSGAGAITAGDALDKVGNTLNVKVDGQGIEISADQLILELDGSTLSKSASGLKVATGGILNNEVGAAASIDYSKLNLATSIVNGDINASAAIAYSKLASLSSANILVGSAGGVATSVAMSGDITITNAGVTAIGSLKVTSGMLAGSIAYSKLASLSTAAPKALVSDASGFVSESTVTGVELGYLSGVTSAIQTQLTNKANLNSNIIPTVANSFDIGSTSFAYKEVVARSTAIQDSAASFVVRNTALKLSIPTSQSTALTITSFATSAYKSGTMDYEVVEATTGATRSGVLKFAANSVANTVGYNDVYSESEVIGAGISLLVTCVAGTVTISVQGTDATNAAVLKASMSLIAV